MSRKLTEKEERFVAAALRAGKERKRDPYWDEPFRPGMFGIPRVNYSWWARNLVQVEKLPDGVPLIFDRDWREPDPE